MNRKARRARAKAVAHMPRPPSSAFAKAVRHHKAGRLRDALREYGAVPSNEATYPDAMRL
jgi:hypothetical protein